MDEVDLFADVSTASPGDVVVEVQLSADNNEAGGVKTALLLDCDYSVR